MAAAEGTPAAQAEGATPSGTPARTGLLIIGASQSGVQLAVSLRALGFDEHITLLGDEDHRPYQRPALSKEFLQGTVESESLIFRSNEYWAEHNVDLVKGEFIIRIDKDADGSGVAHSSSGKQFPFKRLALTVGARARKLEIEGGDLDGVLYLRNADDALALKARVGDARDVVVIGGGFIGLEAASSLQKMGKNVTVLEFGQRLVGRAVGEETAEYFLQAHRSRGLDIRLSTSAKRFIANDAPGGGRPAVAGVELQDGTVLPAQIVLIGIGVIPNTQLAEQLGLTVENGIVVDRFALASDGTTVAIGDCANMPNPVPGSAAGGADPAGKRQQRDRARQGGRLLADRPARGIRRHPVVLVQPGGPQAADRRTVQRLRPDRPPAGPGTRKIQRPLLPPGPGHRRGLRQCAAGLHGCEKRPGQGPEHPCRGCSRFGHTPQDDHDGQLAARLAAPEGAL